MKLFIAIAIIFFLLATPSAQTIPEQLWGKWIVHRILPTTTIPCWDEVAAKNLLGTEIEYSKEIFRWRNIITRNPDAESTMISADLFREGNSGQGSNRSEVTFHQLGIEAQTVMRTKIHHAPGDVTGGTVEIPGDEVLVKDKDTIVFAACNVYFEANRASAPPKTN